MLMGETPRGAAGNGGAVAPLPAVDLIRDRILDLTLQPGARIDDKLLMSQFGLGRTPTREAFNRLAAEGLIVIQRNKGATVRPLDIAHVGQFFDAYGASERLVGYFCRTREPALAAELRAIEAQYERADAGGRYLEVTRLNAEFHGRLARASGNEYLCDFAGRLYNHARRLSYFIHLIPGEANRDLGAMQEAITGHHQEIIAAVEAHDNDALVRVLTLHAGFFHHWVMEAISVNRGLSAPLPARL